MQNFSSTQHFSLSVHVTSASVVLALFTSALTDIDLADLADKVLVLLDIVRFEANAEQVVPELALVTLYPMNLEI